MCVRVFDGSICGMLLHSPNQEFDIANDIVMLIRTISNVVTHKTESSSLMQRCLDDTLGKMIFVTLSGAFHSFIPLFRLKTDRSRKRQIFKQYDTSHQYL